MPVKGSKGCSPTVLICSVRAGQEETWRPELEPDEPVGDLKGDAEGEAQIQGEGGETGEALKGFRKSCSKAAEGLVLALAFRKSDAMLSFTE